FAVGVIGPGKVGGALLDQLRAAQPQLLGKANLDLRLRAIASSTRMLLDERGISGDWRERFRSGGEPLDLDRFTAQLVGSHLPHMVIVDCSASPAVADRYAGWLAAGIHVVTPNKQAGAGPGERFAAIREAAAASGARFRYEATVGAGLPVISTLRDLVDTGDAVTSVEGILSGTLAWLFNRYDGSVPFSELVSQARELGYTEPDPRDDLSGTDVARKLVILAREAGWALNLEDVAVESLVPASLREASVDDFMVRLPEVDAVFAERLGNATAGGQVLRYVARLDAQGHASVGLVEVPADHAFANLRLTDNIVQFTTRRYCDNPLIVQGPGAGPEVTAAGVFADLLRVAAGQGAKL
ncbi:MAG: bifunctional aspartate kinase/homoserine dehydrogenase I, partial [Lysobacteraceae bacterium]